jgi:hypothetical protein
VSQDKLPIIATPLRYGIHVTSGYVSLVLMRDEAQRGGLYLGVHIPNALNFPPEHGPLIDQLEEVAKHVTPAFRELIARVRDHERVHGPLIAEPEGDADAA